jgi:hypothetical protein
MAIINTTDSVGLVGLKSLATKNKLSDTVVPIWDLTTTSSKVPEKAEAFLAVNPGQESMVGAGDERVMVPKEHFAPGGKYRCK